MRVGDLAFPLGLLMYACMFIGTKKILAPVFGEKKDALWKFAVIYPGATFLLNVALMMIVGQVAAYMLFSF